jgi:hypothetical protein
MWADQADFGDLPVFLYLVGSFMRDWLFVSENSNTFFL